jgi:hypothetical protein
MNDDLLQRLTELAASPVLLVASDFDGTLAPIVSRPDLARADASAADAIGAIARLDHSHAAVISGRGRDELSRLCGDNTDLWLVGSHGAEFPGFPMPPFDHDDLARVAEAFERSAESRLGIKSGAVVERKPAGVAFHYRRVPAELAGTARQLGVPVRNVYTSNAEDYWGYSAQFRDNMRALPFDEQSWVVRTRPIEAWGLAPDDDYHYNVQGGLNFQLWMRGSSVSDCQRLMRNRSRTSVVGLSRLEAPLPDDATAPPVADAEWPEDVAQP